MPASDWNWQMTSMATGTAEITEDAFLGGAVMALQPSRGYRAGLDAVLLAAAIPVASGPTRVLDVGAGVGVAGLCVARRCPQAQVTLLEVQTELAALATQNTTRNGLADRVSVVVGDALSTARELTVSGIPPDHFDHVMANPPFGIEGRGRTPADSSRARAHEMADGALDAWVHMMARSARPGGTLTLVHRADALADLLAALAPRAGGIIVAPLQPRTSAGAVRVIIQATKASRAPLVLAPPIVLHGEDGAFTPTIDAVLRSPRALPVAVA